MKICMSEVCLQQDRGSIGAFYIRHWAERAGYAVDVVDRPLAGYDVELVSVHHAEDFVRLATTPKRATWRIVGGHPMQNNPRPAIPFADLICVGEGESWIGGALDHIAETGAPFGLSGVPGTIVPAVDRGRPIPAARFESPLPDNPPYLNRPDTRSAAWYVEMARGCPFSCAYCELGHSAPCRLYSEDRLRAAIDACDVKRTRKINFYAPDEASHPKYAELYAYLRENGFAAGFSSMRVDSVLRRPPPVLANHLIRVGVDGLTEATRRRVDKPITNAMLLDYFRMFLDRGHCNFKMFMIVGYPWDVSEDFAEFEYTMRRIMALDLKKNVSLRIKWTPFIPQPCTPLGDATPTYDYDWSVRIHEWHARWRRPRREPGWFIENDGLMSPKSHRRQCELTAGDETVLLSYPNVHPLHEEYSL